MTTRQKQLIENYIRLKVKKLMKESSGINPESIESINTWLDESADVIELLKTKLNNNQSNSSIILNGIRRVESNMQHIEMELKK